MPTIKAKLLLHYAGLDERIDAGIPAFKAALDEAGAAYTMYMYEGVNHAFNNDTSAARYDAAAATLPGSGRSRSCTKSWASGTNLTFESRLRKPRGWNANRKFH